MSTHRTGRDPRELALRTLKPRRTAFRLVHRQGNSLVISLPLEFLKALGLAKGDYVEMVLNEYSNRLYVKRAHQSTRRRVPEPAVQLPLEGPR